MKALFYTATAVFITFAGVIAYFALQAPASSIGDARIVLDIDVSGMPAAATGSNANAPLDPYANEPDDKPEAAGEPSPSSDTGSTSPQNNSGGQQMHSAVVHETNAAAPPASQQHREEIPAPPPGTALAGLQQDGPLFREVAPDQRPEPSVDPAAGNQPAETTAAAAEPAHQLPGTNRDLPPSAPVGREALRGGADIGLNATTAPGAMSAAPAPAEVASLQTATAPVEAAVPVLPPPPVPVRRPNNIPSAGERVAAADGSWGGLQFATTEVTTPKAARVAILLRGIGRSEQDSDAAIARLPSAVSLGFLPYAAGARQLASRARERGHEVIVQLPLEPTDYPATNPGPDTLLTTLPPEENAARLQSVLRRFEGHTGVTNLMGGKMLQSKASLKPFLEDIKARGLVYVGENYNSAAVKQVAREINLRFGAAQVLIDASATPEAIEKALARLVVLARQNGSAIGMGNASAMTIGQVEAWSEKLAAQGITLVPVGALAQAPGSS